MSNRRVKLTGEWENDWKPIKDFIENSLVTKLKNDQRELKISSEGDLQSCVYYHLRRFIKKTPRWYILNKLTIGTKEEDKSIPDIAIVRLRPRGTKMRPVFLMELKETVNPLHQKFLNGIEDDFKKLKRLIKSNKLAAQSVYGYLIIFVQNKTHSTESIREEVEKRNRKRKHHKFPASRVTPLIINTWYDEKAGILANREEKLTKLRKYRG